MNSVGGMLAVGLLVEESCVDIDGLAVNVAARADTNLPDASRARRNTIVLGVL